MIIYVDIDETICFYDGVDRLGYKNAVPNYKNIQKINIKNYFIMILIMNMKYVI